MANDSAWRKGQQDAFHRRPTPNLARVATPIRNSYLGGKQAGLKQIQDSKKSGK